MIRELDRKPPVHANVGDTTHEFGPNSRDSERCPICDGPSESLFQKNGYQIRDCLACGHRFAELVHAQGHVERVYADEYFNGASGGYANYLADGKLLVSHGRRYARILNRYTKPGTILDVGAAAGFNLKGFETAGWTGTGLEPNPSMADFARSTLEVTVETGTLEETQIARQYDLVAMIQVVAHFVDPRRAFEAANKLTKPGGYWLIETWNRDNFTARILGEAWHEYNPPSVLHGFSADSLKDLIQGYGLREVARGRPTKWISPSHARAIANAETSKNILGKTIAFGTKLIPETVHIPYVLDDVFWGLYQNPG